MEMKRYLTAGLLAGLCAAGSFAVADNDSDRGRMYEVTITNLTKSQVLTPALAVTHRAAYSLFQIGHPASAGLMKLAETGDPSDAQVEALNERTVRDAVVDEGVVIPPGHSSTVMVSARRWFRELSVAGMLATTNDAFYAVHGVELPNSGSRSFHAMAYDAGTEYNNESCDYVPGPPCPPESGNMHADGDVGFVHIHNGVHGVGDLDASMLDWRGPVALITVKRVH